MSLQKRKPIVSTVIRQSARGQPWTVRVPGICNFNPETTVLAHISGGGVGGKADDIEAAYCCSSCHDEIDRRTMILDFDKVLMYHFRGCIETRRRLYDAGILKIA